MSKLKTRLNFNSSLSSFFRRKRTLRARPIRRRKFHFRRNSAVTAPNFSFPELVEATLVSEGDFFSSRKAVGHTGGHVPNFFPFLPGSLNREMGANHCPYIPLPPREARAAHCGVGRLRAQAVHIKQEQRKSPESIRRPLLLGPFT